jgi:hypothetical protein
MRIFSKSRVKYEIRAGKQSFLVAVRLVIWIAGNTGGFMPSPRRPARNVSIEIEVITNRLEVIIDEAKITTARVEVVTNTPKIVINEKKTALDALFWSKKQAFLRVIGAFPLNL